jgi:hypothetical protein
MKFKNQIKFITLIIFTVIGNPLYASDSKVMSGAECQPRSTGDLEDIFTLETGVLNIDPADKAFVICPIVRDNTSTNLASRFVVDMRVKGSTNDKPVTCRLSSRKSTGAFPTDDIDPVTNESIHQDVGSGGGAPIGTSTGFAHIVLDVPANPTRDGYYVVQCELPEGKPGGSVISYTYTESTPTDQNN